GMVGQATLVLATEQRLAVPEAALIHDGAECYVLVEQGPGQYARLNVVSGRQDSGLVEVRAGKVYKGDRVVTAGCQALATYFTQGSLRLSPEAARGIGLRVESAQRQPVDEVVELTGAIELPPERRAVVASQLAGPLRRVLVDREQQVAAGTVVAEIDSL